LSRDARFGEASALALDGQGNLYIGDGFNQRVRVIYGADSDADTDGDGYSDAAEIAIEEDPGTYCAIMRADVGLRGRVNILDLTEIASAFNEAIPPVSRRLDQNADARINILDLTLVASNYGRTVTACP
jgi:hypothetical protein